jgi:signal peptidase II
MKYILLLTLPLYMLDQVTKHLVLRFIGPQDEHVVVPDVFKIVMVTNDGAAFGSFKNNNVFFIVLACVAFVFVFALLLRRTRSRDWLRDISLALLLAGIMGNLTDRFLHGHVIDFLLFDFGPHVPKLLYPYLHPWPAFNVADSCIFIAVACFVVHSLKRRKEAEAASQS